MEIDKIRIERNKILKKLDNLIEKKYILYRQFLKDIPELYFTNEKDQDYIKNFKILSIEEFYSKEFNFYFFI
jgi:cell fate regulator YaaT (PSP1 superfamily)